jgi:hypothetical protein
VPKNRFVNPANQQASPKLKTLTTWISKEK